MTTQTLETRLREKIVTETPRPGFETRIQAMAREPFAPEKKGFIRRFAVPAMAVLAIFVVIAPGGKPSGEAVSVAPIAVEPTNVAITESINEAPVQREIRGLKNDARRTMSLFQKALPSFPISKKQQEE
ncbi:hypothetical protein OAE72_01835 [Akkermansiaceae bacterium]|nr:hypothetical protein [Akkermansiaceae bacterium]MDA7907754.1 hypothetical protein [Akkermansiaceae bacterium]MDB4572513.1 hypothetical protein [Akkermansiaceae bacterium]MDB4680674.1 hypothetical protein [Akkermansiaceae bacterium]